MKNNILLFLFIYSFSHYSFGQITFQKTYGASFAEYASFSQQTADGGYIICGRTFSFGNGNGDVYLIKTDENGDTLWTKVYGDIDTDEANSVQQTNDGGYILVGCTSPCGSCDHKSYLIKTDANGDTIWTKTYESNNFKEIKSIKQTTDGGYIMVGLDCSLVKSDSNGTILWAKTYGGTGDDRANSIQRTTDGGFIITGTTNSFGAGNYDFNLIKTDSAGNLTWAKTYGGLNTDNANSVQQTSDGGFIIAGTTLSFGIGWSDFLAIKTDINGNMLWSKTYGTANGDWAYYIQQTNDGGYVIAGSTENDVYLIKTNANGDPLWTKSYGGSGVDQGQSVQQTKDGGYIVAGYSDNSFDTQSADFYLIKTDANGNSGCNENIISTIVTIPSIIVTSPTMIVSNINPVISTPLTQISSGCTVLNLCFNTGIASLNEEYELNVYPNPSSGIFTVSLKNKTVEMKICVYDVLGSCLLKKDCRNDGNPKIDLSCQPQGIYFYRIAFSNGEFATGKLVVE
jgi:hypothetical protein